MVLFKQFAFTFLILLFFSISICSQTNALQNVQSHFNKYNEANLQEKIFVHTDREFYVAGEIIWFKIYCTSEENNRLQDLSKVAYVEVLDKDQEPVLQAKISLKDGTGSGSLVLPAELHSGNYRLRAYTSWMKNFDPGFYFHQTLTVINTIQTDTIAAQKAANNYHVNFFPEGGELVNGLTSKVAFRVTDNTGRGIDFNGVITAGDNDTILHFKPVRFGIGNFSFTPKKNTGYKAIITTVNGNTVTQNMPAARDNGFVINVSNAENEGKLKLTIQTNTTDNFSYLFIHTRQQIKAAEVINFTNGHAVFEIEKSILGEGITHITLFDKGNEPVCERLYFKRPQQRLIIDVSADNNQYLPRKKVNIHLLSKDESNGVEAADISMAVFQVDSSSVGYNDIYSYLWLSSDLKGQVESPEYYFNDTTAAATEALDNLMLTHGWRRFMWKNVMEDTKPALEFLPEYEGHIVSGKIINRANERPVSDMLAYLSIPGRHFRLYTAKSTTDGSVNFNTRDFFGTRLMTALVNPIDSTAYRVDLLNPFSESDEFEEFPAFAPATEPTGLLKRSINMQVQNVFTAAQLNVLEQSKTDTTSFYGKPDARYMLDDYTRFPTMEEVLREYVREVNVRKQHNNFILSIVNKDENGIADIKNPVILLDGVPQFDLGNKITNYDPLKVQRLETINEAYYLGPARFDGIVSFFTYKGDVEGFKLDTTATVLDYDALQQRREFYQPVYETAQQYATRLPDFRSLLYWSPDIKTGDTGKKDISFYTSDLTGKFAIVVQGISQQGKAGSKVFLIDVKKDR